MLKRTSNRQIEGVQLYFLTPFLYLFFVHFVILKIYLNARILNFIYLIKVESSFKSIINMLS